MFKGEMDLGKMSSSFALAAEKKHWWLSNRKIVEKYVKDARALIATNEHSEIVSALNLLDSALALSPRFEAALELKARSLMYLRRYKDVADLLQEYIPSYKMHSDESSSSDNSSQLVSRERAKLLSSSENSSSSVSEDTERERSFKCFSVSDLKKKVLAGMWKSCENEGQWRYLVLGQACCHLGLMEDALVLLQTGRRLANAAFRRQSISWSDDSFSSSDTATFIFREISSDKAPPPPPSESENITHLLAHIKLLLRRRAAALAALDSGAHSEAIRHFSKIVDSRRSTPQGFLAECYIHRAGAYRAAGRIAEAIADCNRTLALDPPSIPALSMRASLLESIGSITECLHDLEHLKLLHDTILRDRRLPGPAWKRHFVRYGEISKNMQNLTSKIQELRQRVRSGEVFNVDYYALIGLRRGCTRSELERAHLLLGLRHRPDKAISFIDRCEFGDDRDIDAVKDQARMSALLLYRLLQKGYSSIMTSIMEDNAAEKQRQKLAPAVPVIHVGAVAVPEEAISSETAKPKAIESITSTKAISVEVLPKAGVSRVVEDHGRSRAELLRVMDHTESPERQTVFQGVFCRDLAVVGNLLSQVGFNRPIPVKYEALSC